MLRSIIPPYVRDITCFLTNDTREIAGITFLNEKKKKTHSQHKLIKVY